MTTRPAPSTTSASTARPRLLTGSFGAVLVVDFGAMSGFYLLLAVVPMHASAHGADGLGAGLTTAVLMFASVAGELITPRMAARVGDRRLLAGGLAAAALFVQALASTVTRYLGGRSFDHHGPRRLLVPGVLLVAGGMGASAETGSSAAVLAGMVVFGAGFGLVQTATLNLMVDAATPTQYGAVSAAWNVAYDLGWGLGAAAVGELVTSVGFPLAFAATAAAALGLAGTGARGPTAPRYRWPCAASSPACLPERVRSLGPDQQRQPAADPPHRLELVRDRSGLGERILRRNGGRLGRDHVRPDEQRPWLDNLTKHINAAYAKEGTPQ